MGWTSMVTKKQEKKINGVRADMYMYLHAAKCASMYGCIYVCV